MRGVYDGVCMLFIALELSCAYDQYFNLHDSHSIAAPKFLAYHKLRPEAIRMVEWYGLWVANGKVIMSLLLFCTTFVAQRRVRCACAMSMVAGSMLYFYRMGPLLQTLGTTMGFDLDTGIFGIAALWAGAAWVEARYI